MPVAGVYNSQDATIVGKERHISRYGRKFGTPNRTFFLRSDRSARRRQIFFCGRGQPANIFFCYQGPAAFIFFCGYQPGNGRSQLWVVRDRTGAWSSPIPFQVDTKPLLTPTPSVSFWPKYFCRPKLFQGICVSGKKKKSSGRQVGPPPLSHTHTHTLPL